MDRDGIVELEISSDAMAVKATFLPATGEGRSLTPDYVEAVLEGREIVFGVDWEAINEAVFEVNTSHHAIEGLLVARGEEAVSQRAAFYRVLGVGTRAGGDSEDPEAQIDWKRTTRIPVVRAGQVIARKIPARPGKPGTNVLGEEIPFGTDSVTDVQPGKNTKIVEDRVLAERGGRFVQKGNEFFVEDRLEVDGAVGFETGSIEFPGDVLLKGDVKDGFHIWASGSIQCTVTIDVSEVFCRKDFSGKGGIIGRNKHLLRAGGRVIARFVGNCNVESKSSIFIQDYIYHSKIACLDRVAMGDKGKIIGGVTTAANGIRCYQLGNAANIPTLARVGMDFVTERKMRISKERFEKLTIRMDRMRKNLTGEPTDRQLDILDRIDSARMQLSEQLAELTESLDTAEEAVVEVPGVVYPGVTVQICRATYTVDSEAKKVRFRLEKATGRVLVESMDAS